MVAQSATVVIRGGTVVDGSGGRPVLADVAILDDRIVAVGPSLEVSGSPREIDATGLVVTPGWVDVHTHYVRAASLVLHKLLLLSVGIATFAKR